jgi:hypothetical protein
MTTQSWIRNLFVRRVTPIRKAPRRARLVLEALEDRWVPSTFTVNSIGDTGTGTGVTGDLRYCLTQANGNNQANIIKFDPTVFGSPQTITLSGTQLEISDTGGTQTINGPKVGVTLSGNYASRVFQIDRLVTASISGLTISGGNGNYIGYSGYHSNPRGGGLANYGTTTLTNCTVSGNAANNAYFGGSGGGLSNSGTLALTNCTISGNFSSFGGGVANFGTTTLTNCMVSGNSAGPYDGGGVANFFGTTTLTNCTVSGNSAGGGGGMYNDATLTLTNCTITGNSAGGGGGLYNRFGNMTLTNCTITGNSAGGGGGLRTGAGETTLTNCTITGNSAVLFGGGVDTSGSLFRTPNTTYVRAASRSDNMPM